MHLQTPFSGLYLWYYIYTAEEIEKAKASPSFEREYNLKYLGRIGNVFHTKDIEAAIEKGRKYNPDNFNPYYSFIEKCICICICIHLSLPSVKAATRIDSPVAEAIAAPSP
jgi:hypothetical protein